MSELRYIERNGQKILQLLKVTNEFDGTKWVDVPLVSDPPKSSRQEKIEELAKHIGSRGPMVYRHLEESRPLAEAALEWVEGQLDLVPFEVEKGVFHTVWKEGYNAALSYVRKNLGLYQ